MKKLILILTVLYLTNFVNAQSTINIPNKVIHNEVSTLPDAPKPIHITIDTVKQAIVSKDTIQVLDSTIRTQGNTIIDKEQKVKELEETTIPVGTGNSIYLIIGIAILILIVFIATKKSWGKYVTLREIDLIKGFKTAFLMALLTGTGNIINTGVFPTDLKTWKFILLTSLSAGLVYLIKNAFTPDKKEEVKTEVKNDEQIFQ
jgi:hypothetical protein